EFFLSQECSQGKTGGNWFCNGHHVGRHAEGLKSKNVSGAAESALNLVEDQRCTMMIGNCPAFLQEIYRAFIYSAFPENRLEHDGASIFIHGRSQCFNVVFRNKFHILEQRFEPFAVFVLAGQGHSAESASMIGTL